MALFAVGALALGAYSASEQRAAADKANRAQQEGMGRALGLTEAQYQQSRQDLMPWTQAGKQALSEQQSLMGLGGDTAGAMRSLQSSPGYQSRLAMGERSLAGSSAARGGMGSGKALMAAGNYGQDYASNEYGNRLSQLANLSGTGQSAAAGQAAAGQQYAGNMSNLITGGANAEAASGMAASQATQSSLLGGAQLGLAGYQALNQPKNQWQTYYSMPGTYSWRS